MKRISSHTFKYTLKDIHKNTESRKFCFVLGAGASFKSGIKTGGQMATQWYEEINARFPKSDLDAWRKEVKLDENDLASHYGPIYRKRFANDKTSGYEFLVQAMKDAKPSFGHIVLAQMLSKVPGHCVLTTNFDSLVETAIYQFTNKTPLVVGHESLSGYARPSRIHPLIVKIHRDLLLSPKSDPSEISQLDAGWKEPLDNIFGNHIPIVIGYGGNDGSLMEYFEKMSKPSNFFWCTLSDDTPSDRVKNLVKKMDGSFVDIKGFDQLMHELLWVFSEIKPIEEELKEITASRINLADEQLKELKEKRETVTKEINKPQEELSAYEYSELADDEPDFENRKAIYLEALEKFPDVGWLWGQFVYFLQFEKKEFNDLEEYHLKTLSLIPEHSSANINYALFLSEIKKEYERAEKYYLKALELEPDDANINSNYASFLLEVRKDYENAEQYFKKALALDPKDANSYGNYASFLLEVGKDYENAEQYFKKALALDPKDATIYGNYANFLADDKKDYKEAEKYYLKALELDPEDVNVYGNYANFLANDKEDYKEAEMCYLKALELGPDNANIYGNYANFLADIKEDYDKAEKSYLKALKLDPEHINNIGNYASFLVDVRMDYGKAEEYHLKALVLDPESANKNGNYAKLLLITDRVSDASPYLEKAFKLNGNEKSDLILELWFYKYAHFPVSQKEAEGKIVELLDEGVRAIDWDLDENVKVAIENGHSNPKKLKEYAKRITTEETNK